MNIHPIPLAYIRAMVERIEQGSFEACGGREVKMTLTPPATPDDAEVLRVYHYGALILTIVWYAYGVEVESGHGWSATDQNIINSVLVMYDIPYHTVRKDNVITVMTC